MAKSTLLQIVQDMLTAIDSESVTTVVSGSTTEEALMCVNIANRTFESLITRAKWKHIRDYKALQAGGNLNELTGDTNDLFIDGHNVWYGTTDDEQRIPYEEPEDFVRKTIARTSADSDVTVINDIKVYNNREPSFFTTFDGETLVFDAIPDGSGLVAGNSKALVYVEPTTRLSADAGTYDLPKQVYPHFRDLCIAGALEELAGEEARAERLKRRARNEISKAVRSGHLIDTADDAWRNIPVRRGVGKKRSLIII